MIINWNNRIRLLCLVCVALALSACGSTITTSSLRQSDDHDAANYNARLGAQYFQRGNLDLANEKITKALSQDNNNALAHVTMAQLQFAINRPGMAEKHFERAMTLEPDNADNRNAYGVFLCRTGSVERAEQEFAKAANNPFYDTPEFALDNAGICMLDVGRLREAENYLITALRKNPKFGNAYLHLAELRFKERRLTIADSFLERHHEYSPISSASLWLGLQIHRDGGNLGVADQFAKRLLNEFPNSTEAGAYLAQSN